MTTSRESTAAGKSSAQAASVKDIWTLVKEAKEREKKAAESPDTSIESTLFFVGNKNAGKSSLILRFLDREEPPAPTVGLEYTFGRRTRGVNAVKDVAHIWELAGGIFLSDLIKIPVNEANVHTVTFVIVIDLSEPAEALKTLEHLIGKIKSTVNSLLDSLEQRGSKRPRAMRAYAWKKFGAENVEKEFLDPCAAPIVVIGTKYDVFRDMESEKRKMLAKTLRYIAHTNGASLMFVSQKDENTVAKCRQLLSHHAFKGSSPKTMSVDHNKPIVILAGQDSLSHIGPPPSEMGRDTVGKQSAASYRQWKADFDKYFPPVTTDVQKEIVDFSKYPEQAIDALRAQKDEELEKLRRHNERKAKEVVSLTASASSAKETRRRERAARAAVQAQ
ncbi:uncharacterized protein SPPG_04256 [Spizellomyces punctatus DAOM BR117]|uniref:Cytoplasmic dynein 2 light intermediate chain 1 n=1 Tax=Spizellomyces punctatus (strain DAOM BR117) TaxID=645134 RepID=A0A0L0HIA4_SPIPD|nr:uncharacterized protein SPPG_04256 [Spizellomyces punctatus DAOM BR117]KND01166.1 hypothetical protein SPPG_04256 [Spizellomyces punctatus DAOM BR117]|eukprot:XP_016609205.1 hypothetical protein SPPG_04256 [Spizellomyces punctatus DAOM BR117]